MRLLACIATLWLAAGASPAPAQIPDQGRFDYILYDNGDRPVGTYFFSISREAGLWRITSDMNVDTRFLLMPIRFRDQNSFTHDGKAFHSFQVKYFKDVPLQGTVRMEVSGTRIDDVWKIQTQGGGKKNALQLGTDSFQEIRNLVSRLIRPEAVLMPGQVRRARSLDPITLEVSQVESRGIEMESIEFQGRKRDLYVMEIRAPDGNAKVKKFANGLIYRSQTEDGYALLKSAQTPSF